MMMIQKSVSTLSAHKQLAHRGLLILLRNLYGIIFGPMFSQSWENTISRAEQTNGKHMHARINVESLKRMKHFFESPKVRKVSGAALACAIINPSYNKESFEHRLTLIWFGGPGPHARLYKLDGVKRTGVTGFSTEQTTWPLALTEVPRQGADLWTALQTFIQPQNVKSEWTKEKAAAWDTIVSQPTGSTPFASGIALQGPQTFCAVTNDEENLAVDLKNGLVERLKAITMQLDAMP